MHPFPLPLTEITLRKVQGCTLSALSICVTWLAAECTWCTLQLTVIHDLHFRCALRPDHTVQNAPLKPLTTMQGIVSWALGQLARIWLKGCKALNISRLVAVTFSWRLVMTSTGSLLHLSRKPKPTLRFFSQNYGNRTTMEISEL